MRLARTPAARLRTLPRGLRGGLGVLAAVLGVTIVFRPTASLGVLALLIGAGFVLTGGLELVAARDAAAPPRWRVALAVLWIAGGVVVLLAPGLTVRAVALAVGLALLVNGVLQVVSGCFGAGTADARVTSMLLGLAWIVFGGLALAWPDITLLVVGVAFGARLVVDGLLAAWRALREPSAPPDAPDAPDAPDTPRPARHRWRATLAAALALAVALAAGSVSVLLRRGSPVVDAFYAPPRDVPGRPGQLIRSEPFDRGVPDGAQGWRILYTTSHGNGSAAVASGLVVVPRGGTGDWPVISWTHGTTGFAEQCAPSLLPEPFTSGALLVLPELIENGWALVATDYPGLGTAGPHPYLIGVPSGQAALDAVRAARQLADAHLGARTVAWGHSQGGGAALWAGALAARYAPDVPLSGVAALAPASNAPALMANQGQVQGGSVFASYAFAAYAAHYPEVTYREYIRPGAEETVRRLADRCLSSPDALASVLVLLGLAGDPEIFARPPLDGALGRRLQENTPPATISAPLLIAQGATDGIVTRAGQEAFVEGLCAAGQQVDYRVYAGKGHMPLVESDSPLVPQLFAWTAARFNAERVESGCTRADY